MTKSEADSLALFLKDHDTRFLPKIVENGDDCTVELTTPESKTIDTVHTTEEYAERHILSRDPGPTIRAAWEKFGK